MRGCCAFAWRLPAVCHLSLCPCLRAHLTPAPICPPLLTCLRVHMCVRMCSVRFPGRCDRRGGGGGSGSCRGRSGGRGTKGGAPGTKTRHTSGAEGANCHRGRARAGAQFVARRAACGDAVAFAGLACVHVRPRLVCAVMGPCACLFSVALCAMPLCVRVVWVWGSVMGSARWKAET